MNILDILREHPQWYVSVSYTDGYGVYVDVGLDE